MKMSVSSAIFEQFKFEILNFRAFWDKEEKISFKAPKSKLSKKI